MRLALRIFLFLFLELIDELDLYSATNLSFWLLLLNSLVLSYKSLIFDQNRVIKLFVF